MHTAIVAETRTLRPYSATRGDPGQLRLHQHRSRIGRLRTGESAVGRFQTQRCCSRPAALRDRAVRARSARRAVDTRITAHYSGDTPPGLPRFSMTLFRRLGCVPSQRPMGDARVALFEHHRFDTVEEGVRGLGRFSADAPRGRHGRISSPIISLRHLLADVVLLLVGSASPQCRCRGAFRAE